MTKHFSNSGKGKLTEKTQTQGGALKTKFEALDKPTKQPNHWRKTHQKNPSIKYVSNVCFTDVNIQGSYWAIDTNPKEDTVPSRPKKRPRSGERVSTQVVCIILFYPQKADGVLLSLRQTDGWVVGVQLCKCNTLRMR